MSEIYYYFGHTQCDSLSFTDDSLYELFLSESYGDVDCDQLNGYYIGKRNLNITVTMWKEDMERGLLFKQELYDDPDIPDWWLDKVFKRKSQ